MKDIWDINTDEMNKGDKKRKVISIRDKNWKDDEGFTHYIFPKAIFNNPWYSIPQDDFELFEKYINGGTRQYPSDGNIPCDVVAREARKVLKVIERCAKDPSHHFCVEASNALKLGKFNLLRGTLKLYLGKYTTRDWRRKRFTDDIDFWMFQAALLDSSLKECGFIKNKKTGEWEKTIEWKNPNTNEMRNEILFAANNLNQLLDFGAGSYLEGSSLKEIFDKKIKRGHDVDLSDIINVAMINDGSEGLHREEWSEAWASFQQAANTRNTRTTANLISLCQYSLGIANYFERLSKALNKYNDLILDKTKCSDEKIQLMCRISIHWEDYFKENGSDKTREMIHKFYRQQGKEKFIHAQNLRDFAAKILDLLNSRYNYLKVKFEIES
jgi:hypothetical protein